MEATATGRATTESRTIADLLGLAAKQYGDRPALRQKRDGQWHDVSYAEVGEAVSELQRGLIALGVEPGERVCILCNTRPEWTDFYFAISAAGATADAFSTPKPRGEC